MEQPNPQVQDAPIFTLVIRWSPAGAMQIQWPQIDDLAKLGMLEMAKAVLVEGRVKQAMGQGSSLVVPAPGMKF